VWEDDEVERQRESSHCREAHAAAAVSLPALWKGVFQQGFQPPHELCASDVEGHRPPNLSCTGLELIVFRPCYKSDVDAEMQNMVFVSSSLLSSMPNMSQGFSYLDRF
jgi:hypothetical protein